MKGADDIKNIIEEVSPFYKEKGEPSEEHKIIYNSSSETLEPIYFWVLDMTRNFFPDVEKLVDNFSSTPGGGHFSELAGKATRMQEQATKMLGQINTVIKSIINIIYDLKDFEMIISDYEKSKSDNKKEKEAGLLALKQRWMDNVDTKKGQGSINMLAQKLNFVTLRDAFMSTDTLEEADKLDLNDRVRRILKARLSEFIEWRKLSEKEIKKRYEVEKQYLKSQVNSLKLYTRWVKPYLKAAIDLEQEETGRDPEAINTFNTLLLELTLLGKNQQSVESAVMAGDLPESFRKAKDIRDYYSCVLIDFHFRGIPQKAGQHYVFGGRVEITFRGYVLNEDELKMLEKKLEESDINDALKFVSGITDESLKQMREDIEHFLEEDQEEEVEEKKSTEDINPFAALLGLGKKKPKKKEEKEEEITEVKEDNYKEKMVRSIAEGTAREFSYKIFDIYKKAHRMQSHPDPFG